MDTNLAEIKTHLTSMEQQSTQIKNLQLALTQMHSSKGHEGDKVTDDQLATHERRISELLLSDKLIHEENKKVIGELREKELSQNQEIARLKAELQQMAESVVEAEKKQKQVDDSICVTKIASLGVTAPERTASAEIKQLASRQAMVCRQTSLPCNPSHPQEFER